MRTTPGVILRHANSGQQFSVDSDVFVSDLRSQSRVLQIEENPIGISQSSRRVLHQVFEVDGDASGARGSAAANAAQARNSGRSTRSGAQRRQSVAGLFARERRLLRGGADAFGILPDAG